MRDMIFVSHATPEDNEFARWISLRLAVDGYPVWCDLTQLLGGEHFWKNAEQAIRERTIKFLSVLSTFSNDKEGPRNELHIAKNVAKSEGLEDFIIPLHIDYLSYTNVNVLLTSINAIPFENGWAVGYSRLLEKLERDGVAKKENFNPTAVTEWWRGQFDTGKQIRKQAEMYCSNWLPIKKLPTNLHLHTLTRSTTGLVEADLSRLPFPGFMDGTNLVSFAAASDFEGKLGHSISIAETLCLPMDEILRDSERSKLITKNMGKRWLIRLLRDNWNHWMLNPLLTHFDFADTGRAFFFKKAIGDSLDLPFVDSGGKNRFRGVVGYKTRVNKTKRYWHFGIQAKPLVYPLPLFSISSHVVFSDDGKNIWQNPKAMHKARRRQCKNWHNPEWRDKFLATLAWLARGAESVRIPTGKDDEIEVSIRPVEFLSEFSYVDPLNRSEKRALLEGEGMVDLEIEKEDHEHEPEDDEDIDE